MITQLTMSGKVGTVEKINNLKYKVKIEGKEEIFELPPLSNADWDESYSQTAEEVVFMKMIMKMENE